MDKSAFQLFKNTNRTNTNAWLHSVPIIDFGRVIKVIDVQTVVVEAVIQTSLSKETYTVTLLSLSSALLEVSDEPKPGDTVLLLFLRKHHPLMFISEIINAPNAAGYNKFSGVGILMSAAKKIAHTIITCYDDDGRPVTDVKSDAELYGTFNNLAALTFCRAVFDSGDEQLVTLLFGQGRPLVEKHLARVERSHGFWNDAGDEWVEMDASVTEEYSVYAPVTKDIQGAQTTVAGLGKENAKEGAKPVETDAPVTETIHGKAPVTRDIRSPQNITIGIGNDESGDPEEQRDAPVTVTMGEKADVTMTSKSGMTAKFRKALDLLFEGAMKLVSKKAVTLKSESSELLEIGNAVATLGAMVDELLQDIIAMKTVGSPGQHVVSVDDIAKFTQLKTKWNQVFKK
jgi:hypothetical protein